MKISTAIARIKASTHDISDEYPNEKCLEFINTALQQTSSLLVAGRYPALIKEVLVREGDSLPRNYMQAAGQYPLRMTNNQVTLLDDEDAVRFRYWATLDALTEEDTDMPYPHDAINEVIVKAAIILALNENEYDVSTDSKILSALQDAISAAMSV